MVTGMEYGYILNVSPDSVTIKVDDIVSLLKYPVMRNSIVSAIIDRLGFEHVPEVDVMVLSEELAGIIPPEQVPNYRWSSEPVTISECTVDELEDFVDRVVKNAEKKGVDVYREIARLVDYAEEHLNDLIESINNYELTQRHPELLELMRGLINVLGLDLDFYLIALVVTHVVDRYYSLSREFKVEKILYELSCLTYGREHSIVFQISVSNDGSYTLLRADVVD